MQLSYPWFLLGLGSVIIPITIHLLRLRRPQRLLFTNIEFIREVAIVTVRQRKLQHLLVLAARVFGLAALVLAFCQPFIPVNEPRVSLEASAVDVLVDNSASMQRPAGNRGLFDATVAKARELGKIYSSARFRILNNSSAITTRSAYQAKLTELRPTSGGSALNRLNVTGSDDGHNNPLYIFSDFQKSTFNPLFLKQANTSRQVVLVPSTGEKTGNVFVDSVWFDEALVRARTNLGLHIRLQNGGTEAVADCPVKVYLGAQQAAAFQATVLGGQSMVSVVQVQLPEKTGVVLGRVVTEDAPVVFDNTYYFTAQAASTIRVVEIGPVPVAKDVYKGEPLFSYSFAKPENIDYNALRKANLVFLREVPLLAGGLRDALREVVARGGSVAIVPTGTVGSRASYGQLFRDLGMGPANWEPLTAVPESHEVALPNARESFFRDVLGAQPRAVAMPRVAPVLRWSRTGTDILRMRDGESYLAEFPSGTGKVYVFSAPFAKEYSDFTNHALFVPVLYKLAMRSFRNEQQPAYRLTQNAVSLALPAVSTAGAGHGDQSPFRLVRDGTTWLPAQRIQGGEVRLGVPTGLEAPGFYQVQRAGQVLTTVAFNGSPKESELATYSADELRALVGPGRPNVRVLDGGRVGDVGLAQLQAERGGQPLWRYFLGLALAALFAEALLLRFGRPRVGAARVMVAA